MVNSAFLNREFISQVFNSSISTVLKDKKKILKYYNLYLSSISGVTEYNGNNKFKIDVIENYILHISQKSKPTKQETELLEMFKDLFFSYISKNPDIIVSSKIFKYYNCLFDSQRKEQIEKIILELAERVRDIFIKFASKQGVSQKDLNILFEFLTNTLGTNNEGIKNMQESMIKFLLNINKDYGLFSKNFLIQFFTHKFCIQNNYSNIPVYISKKYLLNEKEYTDNGKTYFSSCMISIRQSIVDGMPQDYLKRYDAKRDSKTLQLLHHELQHIKQIIESKNHTRINYSTFSLIKTRILKTYLSDNINDEYKINYGYREIEREANIFGWGEAGLILEKYAPTRKNEIEKSKNHAVLTAYEESVSYQTDIPTNTRTNIQLYNVLNLINIVKKDPKLLEFYPELILFFNRSGQIKSLRELLETYQKIQKKDGHFGQFEVELDVFNEFFKVLIFKNGIYSIKFNEPNSLLICWFEIIIKLYHSELESIKRMYIIKERLPQDLLTHFVYEREEQLQLYKKYIDRNYYEIVHLKNYNNMNDRKESLSNYSYEEICKEYNEGLYYLEELKKYLEAHKDMSFSV